MPFMKPILFLVIESFLFFFCTYLIECVVSLISKQVDKVTLKTNDLNIQGKRELSLFT